MPDRLFAGMTAVITHTTSPETRIAWEEHGGRTTSEELMRELLREHSQPDVCLGTWGEEDAILTRLHEANVEVTDQQWVWDSLREGTLLQTMPYSFDELDKESSILLRTNPPSPGLAPAPLPSEQDPATPLKHQELAPAHVEAGPSFFDQRLQHLRQRTSSPSPAPELSSSSTGSSSEAEAVAAYLSSSTAAAPRTSHDPLPLPYPPSNTNSPSAELDIKPNLSLSPRPDLSSQPQQQTKPVLPAPAPSDSNLSASFDARLSSARSAAIRYTTADGRTGASVIPAAEILRALRAPYELEDGDEDEGDVRRGLSEMHHGAGGYEVRKRSMGGAKRDGGL
ncbi:hypothetical protein JCM8097_000869 [Rhodosporidiobolus ruineniae]